MQIPHFVNYKFQVRQEHYESLKDRRFTALGKTREKKFNIDWNKFTAVKPSFVGRREFQNFDLNELIPYIDWKPFFDVWQLRGKYPNRSYPKIFHDAYAVAQSKKCFDVRSGVFIYKLF